MSLTHLLLNLYLYNIYESFLTHQTVKISKLKKLYSNYKRSHLASHVYQTLGLKTISTIWSTLIDFFFSLENDCSWESLCKFFMGLAQLKKRRMRRRGRVEVSFGNFSYCVHKNGSKREKRRFWSGAKLLRFM